MPDRNETVGKFPCPIRYKDIAPYYDQGDRELIGAGAEGMTIRDALPGSRYFLPPPPMRCGEYVMKRAAMASIGIDTVAIRHAVLTKDHNGHTKCHYCGACGSGCDVGAFFNASDYLIEPASKTGKFEAH